MIDKDLNKLIDSLDMEEENQEVEHVDQGLRPCHVGKSTQESPE